MRMSRPLGSLGVMDTNHCAPHVQFTPFALTNRNPFSFKVGNILYQLKTHRYPE